jgi:[ribosomal protein S18]-alanine N-acetyltransferase
MGSSTEKRRRLTDVVIRRASTTDLHEVVALEQRCYGDPWPASAFTSLPRDDRVFFAVARQGTPPTLAGYVIAWYVLDEGELANLAVAAELRRAGVAQALLDAMLADALSRRVSQIFLEVRESNAAARQLYAANSFLEIGRRKLYYRKPREDALILRRTLAS